MYQHNRNFCMKAAHCLSEETCVKIKKTYYVFYTPSEHIAVVSEMQNQSVQLRGQRGVLRRIFCWGQTLIPNRFLYSKISPKRSRSDTLKSRVSFFCMWYSAVRRYSTLYSLYGSMTEKIIILNKDK